MLPPIGTIELIGCSYLSEPGTVYLFTDGVCLVPMATLGDLHARKEEPVEKLWEGLEVKELPFPYRTRQKDILDYSLLFRPQEPAR